MTCANAPRAHTLALCCAALPLVVLPAAIALAGSPWLWLVPVGVLVPVALADEWLPPRHDAPPPVDAARPDGALHWGDAWLALFALELLVFLGLAMATLRAGAEPAHSLALAVVLGLLFSVSYNVAHDLIHRLAQPARWLGGFLLLMVVGDAQLAISHVYSHHPNVATADDPASARLGESLYAFAWRSTRGQYAAAWRFETRRLQRDGGPLRWWRHRVLLGALGTLALWAGSGFAFGPLAAGAYVAACVMGKFLFESANYIQHYGLSRAGGEKVGPQHSWDCLGPMSRLFMLNQNHHADHHLRAGRRCWELGPAAQAPLMPHGYLLMLALATLPTWWFRVMDPRAAGFAAAPSPVTAAGAA